MRKVPVLYTKKEECCGCEACSCACDVNAIYMKRDEEGFYYPCIDEKRCIRCGRCLSVCQFRQ